jgi:uncharacterized membrane protein YeaQ/YmgE (transglycosylase-associated protein family)
VIGAIIIGLIAGWLTGKLMRGEGYGLFADILLGLVGAVIGSWIFNALGIVAYGRIGFLAMALVGAIVLVSIVHLIRSPSPPCQTSALILARPMRRRDWRLEGGPARRLAHLRAVE